MTIKNWVYGMGFSWTCTYILIWLRDEAIRVVLQEFFVQHYSRNYLVLRSEFQNIITV